MAVIKNSEIVIGEGITEKYYILSLLDIIKVKPTPIITKPYNMEELEKDIKRYASEGYTTIHCLIDMDNKVNNASYMQKYQRLKQIYGDKIVKKTECKVHFYESHPSIELFFYYYFENSTAEKTNNGLKSWLYHKCGYDTSEKWLKSHSLHNTLVKNGGCLKNAIANGIRSVKLRDVDNYNCSYTEIGDLIEYLGIK
ncbi:MAG: RloB domain-containing protein [Bacteroidaceae bacterium]|nr:RloB domain-containing protein [Bacteroidaceae bacterium]